MELNLLQIANVSAVECIRQQVGFDHLINLMNAYQIAIRFSNQVPTLEDIQFLAQTIEPDKGLGLRNTPVTFTNGGSSCAPSEIEQTMGRFVTHLPASFVAPIPEYEVYNLVKYFLWIHPFRDGNGRTAWVLYNWLRQTLGAPVPLPDFKFGE